MVDNMFVLVGSLASACRHGHGRNIEEQIGHALEHGGLSILVTSFTDIIALGIGALTTLPLVATFCVQITIGIFGNLVFVFTFFTACLAIDQRRVNQSRNGILCCIVHDTPDKTKARLWQSNNLTKDFIDKYYAPFLNLKPVKVCTIFGWFTFKERSYDNLQVIVILITLGMFGAMTYGWTKLEYYTEDEWWVDEDSDSYKYLTTQKEYFPDVGVNVAVYLGECALIGSFLVFFTRLQGTTLIITMTGTIFLSSAMKLNTINTRWKVTSTVGLSCLGLG